MADVQREKSWRDLYRLVLLKEDTLEAVGSYRLSLLNLYLLICSLLVITVAIVVLVIFLTPVKRLVPGYADIRENREYMELFRQIETLQHQVEAQKLYTERFRALLMAGLPDSIVDHDQDTPVSTLSGLPRSGEFPVQPPLTGAVNVPADTFEYPEAGGSVQKTYAPRTIDHLYLIPPVKGPVSAGFDPTTQHYGVDILATKNTPVKAILDGHIITSDWTLETGNTIGIQHANNLVSFYKHNARNLKQLGSFVKAGEAVAIIGNTGEITSGPHLHFELWVDGRPVNPQDFIDF